MFARGLDDRNAKKMFSNSLVILAARQVETRTIVLMAWSSSAFAFARQASV
jgi:hypothetical protein